MKKAAHRPPRSSALRSIEPWKSRADHDSVSPPAYIEHKLRSPRSVPCLADRLIRAQHEFHIDLVADPPPHMAAARQYGLNATDRATYASWIKDKVEKGILIRVDRKDVKFNAPYHCAGDDRQRVVGDFRDLNRLTVPLSDATTHIDCIRAWATKQRYITKFDLSAGFYNVKVSTETVQLLGLQDADGTQYAYTRLPMGVTNGPATFAQWLRHRLIGVIPAANLKIYQDDIFIGGNSEPERDMYAKQILAALSKHRLQLNPKKTQYSETGINILGIELRDGRFRLSSTALTKTIATIEDILSRRTTTKRELYKILGKVNFYRSLAAGVQQLLTPIYQFCKTLPSWNDKQQQPPEVREVLRDIATRLPLWQTESSSTDAYHLYTDASNTGNGVAIYDGNGKVLRHWSGKSRIVSTDAAYKELYGLSTFLHQNTPFMAEHADSVWYVYMDNLPSICYLSRSTVSGGAGKCNLVVKILQFFEDLKIEVTFHHVAGRENVTADRLSRGFL
eukprot:Lankesteria_metandrocarpae@DN5472_c2_g1_i1.p2